MDGVVNNAGSYLTKKGYEPMDIDIVDFDYLTNINVKASFFLMRKAIDYMSDNSICGNILNISSMSDYGRLSLALLFKLMAAQRHLIR